MTAIARTLKCFSISGLIINSMKILHSKTSNDDFVVQTADYTSPPKWHLGHVSWIYEVVLSKLNRDYEFYSKEFSEYLNSYYHQFGEPHDKGKRGIMSR